MRVPNFTYWICDDCDAVYQAETSRCIFCDGTNLHKVVGH